jgi:hypothetical protein
MFVLFLSIDPAELQQLRDYESEEDFAPPWGEIP